MNPAIKMARKRTTAKAMGVLQLRRGEKVATQIFRILCEAIARVAATVFADKDAILSNTCVCVAFRVKMSASALAADVLGLLSIDTQVGMSLMKRTHLQIHLLKRNHVLSVVFFHFFPCDGVA